MLPISNRRCAAFAIIAVAILLVLLGIVECQRRWRDVQNIEARSRLAGVRHSVANYKTIQKRPLQRSYTDKAGHVIGWRQELAPYFDDDMMRVIEAEPSRSEEFRYATFQRAAPPWLRLSFDKSAAEFTSLVAVYDKTAATENEETQWAIIAMENTGIRWDEPRDLTVREFVELLENSNGTSRPLAVLTASGKLGRIDGTSFRFSVLSPGQPSVREFCLDSESQSGK